MIQQSFEVDQQGKTIRGSIYRPGKSVRHPTVLFLHGFAGNRMENGGLYVQLARALSNIGIASVTFDFLNSGESDGSFDQMLATEELADALRMTQWIQSQPFVDRSRLGLLGFSLGGLIAACMMAKVDVFSTLILLAPTTSENLSSNVCKRPQNNCSTTDPLIVGPYVMHPKFMQDLATLKPIENVSKHPRPTLLIQGTGDNSVAPAVSGQFVDVMKRANVPLEHCLIDKADHGFSKPTYRQILQRHVCDFLAKQWTV